MVCGVMNMGDEPVQTECRSRHRPQLRYCKSSRATKVICFIPATGVAGILVFGSLAGATPPGCTDEGWRHYYVGGSRNNLTAWGVSGVIETQPLDVCTNSGTSLWIDSGGGSGNWVQMGYLVRLPSYPNPTVYAEWSSSVTNQYGIVHLLTAPTGSTNTYKVDFSSSNNRWNYYFNGVWQWSVPWDYLRWTPNYMFFMAELHNSMNQTPGRVTNPVSWGYPMAKTSQSGTYSLFSLNRRLDSAISSHTGTNMTDPDSFWETWDTRYP